jgi:hypothetical protein
MDKSLEKRIIRSISSRGFVWAFSSKDFAHLGSRAGIDIALHRLAEKGTIRRVCRGIYDLPKHSVLLDQPLSPDLDAVANAIARKFGWRIQINGASALSFMGLSQQVPGRVVYASDGPSREFKVGKNSISFKHTPPKDAGFAYRESSIIVQGLKSLGADRVDAATITTIRRWLEPRLRKKVLRDTQVTTGWIHAAVAKICREDD